VLVAAYMLAAEEDAADALIAVVDFLASTPKCPSYLVDDVLNQLRAWNAEHEVAEPAPIDCPNCGERRASRIEGEGSVVQHAQIVSVDGKSVSVRPKGCAHPSFSIHCGTCDYRWGSDEYKANPLAEPQVEVHLIPMRPPSEKPEDLN
jgi:hypothetical protein